jgi:hypothetical protein
MAVNFYLFQIVYNFCYKGVRGDDQAEKKGGRKKEKCIVRK